ncbi:MAG: phosphodiester glycosidase family protein [Allorhizobium sp.]
MLLFLKIFLSALALLAASVEPALADCRDVSSGTAKYTVCSFDPAGSEIRIYHLDPDGKPLGGFDSLIRQLWKERHYPIFATNGGMYHDDLSPVGLFAEHGFERTAISTKDGWGNFHLLPNGVFYVDEGRAGVIETRRFLKSGLTPDYATQSGPMLVIDGKIHPRFLPDSDSLKIRNGVGVDADGHVHFAISSVPVRFYDFALLFKDVLDCANALYLDGTISSAYIPERGRRDRFFPLGPIIAVIGTVPQLRSDR